MSSEQVVQVALLTTTRALAKPLDYRLPAHVQVRVGAVVEVPVGKSVTLGVVVGLGSLSGLPLEKLREPNKIYEPSLWLTENLVVLANWVAVTCCSTLGRVFALMVAPKSARKKQRLAATLTSAGEEVLREEILFNKLTARQQEALVTLKAGRQTAGKALSVFRQLEGRGFVDVRQMTVYRRPELVQLGNASKQELRLTAEQQVMIDEITVLLKAQEHAKFLIHGVTGSGKTEVYLQLAKTCLAAGKTVLVLVPEISLTPQTVGRFIARFGDTVAVLHSGLSQGERFDEWQRLQSGEAKICVGARSAVFAPLSSVGLVILDEEHDSSYKNEGDPRYDAREVACRRAEIDGAVLVAGSATPRPESVHSYRVLTLKKRADGSPLPEVKLVDMRKSHAVFHPEVVDALVENKGKAILLLNRRGWSNFLECQSCGHSWECPNCDVTLVLHQQAGVLACHHCGHREFRPEQCSECGSISVARHGVGTERLEEMLRQLYGNQVPVLRLDRDVRNIDQTLAKFAAYERAVLVGTQMVAKGHDFPDVTLGVVLDVDSMLRFPDFRSEERAFGLVTQLAGRVGRGGKRGRVFVQTLVPDIAVLKLAADYRADDFLRLELQRREQLFYPPFAMLVRLVCAAKEADLAEQAIAEIQQRVQAAETSQDALLALLGPAPLFRLKGFERQQLVLKIQPGEETVLLALLDEVVAAVAKQFRHVRFSVDVHPQ